MSTHTTHLVQCVFDLCYSVISISNQVGVADVEFHVHREAHAHDDVDHSQRTESQAPEVHETEDLHQADGQGHGDEDDHQQAWHEEGGDHEDQAYGHAHCLQCVGNHDRVLLVEDEARAEAEGG